MRAYLVPLGNPLRYRARCKRLLDNPKRGQRLVCKVPFGAWRSVTMMAALRHDRMTAPMTLNGAMTGESFRSYITQVLGPTLRRGDIVVMDNVASHRTRAVRVALEKLGVSVPAFPAYRSNPTRYSRKPTGGGLIVSASLRRCKRQERIQRR